VLLDKKSNITPSKVGQSGYPYGYMPAADPPANPTCPTSTISLSKPAIVSSGPSSTYTYRAPITPDTPFLKEVIANEKHSIETLLKVAAKIGPVAQTIVQKEEAYDAAFEATKPSKVSGPSATMQGFALIMFFGSYLILACTMVVYVYITTEDQMKTGITLIIFSVCAAIALALLGRLG